MWKDEIHEREQNTDYLLIALKQALKKRSDLKVILMSATMEGNLMLFTNSNSVRARLYNVERFFLGDVIAMTGFVPEENMFSSMFMSTGFQDVGICNFPTIFCSFLFVVSQYLCYCWLVLGAVLVFLPGFDDITQMRDKILSESWRGRQPVVFTLHSQMNSFEQQKVFDSVGLTERKVILSTNIAEASLTIDDVVFVIDCGKVKEKTYDHTSRISQLKVTWIAKSNAEQRCGRAGRCQEGFCFCLYSVEDYDAMLPTQMAEMQRTAIHDVCLHAKMFAPENMTVKQFLQMAPEPPLADSVDKSMAFLERVQTTLYDVCLARLLLFGVVLRCLNPVVTLVAALSYRDPCMNSQIFYFIKVIPYVMYASYSRQLLIELRRVRMISSDGDVMNALRDVTYNYYSSCWEMVQAAIVAGCYPGIGFVRAGNKLKKIRTRLFSNSHKICEYVYECK
ncbi:unnamed protein product [Angiostrongylus costaricensis]|uniref:Helicase C-terminal domain-containing protein n=1 Tax=Angiostrongylus costaricensis TaxID=334426 RepID=A0A0R3PV76_ANGCS|nr:unnamed protein product [Angiostrongylus costaricensis]